MRPRACQPCHAWAASTCWVHPKTRTCASAAEHPRATVLASDVFAQIRRVWKCMSCCFRTLFAALDVQPPTPAALRVGSLLACETGILTRSMGPGVGRARVAGPWLACRGRQKRSLGETDATSKEKYSQPGVDYRAVDVGTCEHLCGKLGHEGFGPEAHQRSSHVCGRLHAWRVMACLQGFATLECVLCRSMRGQCTFASCQCLHLCDGF